jgi:hypothetical protein
LSVKNELRSLSKNELIKLFLEERSKREELEKKFEEFEKILRAYDNPHTPSSQKRFKENTKKENDENKKDFRVE